MKILILLLVLLVLGIPQKVYAYFSTYVRTKGSKEVMMHESTKFKETIEDGIKHIEITVDEDSDPVFVRVMIIASDEIKERIIYGEDTADKWESKEDGYIYYKDVLKENESAELTVDVDREGLEKDEFDLIIVYEYVPALFDGETWYADWDDKETIVVTGEGGQP